MKKDTLRMKKESVIKEKYSFDKGKSQSQNLLFDNLITIEELSVAFDVTPRTVKKWIAYRKIPFVKMGRKYFFIRKSVEVWLQNKEAKCL